MAMKKTGGLMMYLLSMFMLFSLFSSTAQAFDVSGSVNYSGTKTGRIFLKLQGNGQYGTSVAAPGAFTIRGVPPGTYMMSAFRDVQGTGSRHVTDPSGFTMGPVTVTNANISGADITLADPTTVTTPTDPVGFTVLPADNAALVMWGGNKSGTVEDAESYELYWGTSPDPGSVSTPLGSILNIPAAGEDGTIILTSLNQPTIATCTPNCYFSLFSVISGQAQKGLSKTMVSIGNPSTSGATVTGTVNYTGGSTPTVPLLVALVNATNNRPSQFYAGVVASPTTGFNSFSVTNVPDGTYELHAVLDINGNGIMDIGDLSSGNARNIVSVSGGAVVSGPVAITINDVNAEASVRTNHWKDASSESYNLNIELSGMKKRPVLVTLAGAVTAGAAPLSYITGPIDLALDDSWGGFYAWLNVGLNTPAVGDVYSFNVTYADATTGTITGTVTGVLNSFATPGSPAGSQTYTATPTFTWSAPPSPPLVPWVYTIYLNNQSGSSFDSSWIPNTQTSETFANLFPGQPPLADNSNYNWSINVGDIQGNSASYGTSFSFGTPVTPGTLSITASSLPPGVLSTPYSQNLTATGGTQPYSNWIITSGSLPAGLSLGSSTGLISGTPMTSGNYSFTVQVNDNVSATATQSFSITITDTAVTNITFTSGVQDCSGSSCVNLAGVAVTTVGLAPEVTATSDANGLFTLTVPFTTTVNSAPATAQYYIKMSKSGFADAVSSRMQQTASTDVSNRPYSLYVPTQLTNNWGNTSGKGVIRSRIVDNANLPTGYVGGAIVTATDKTTFSSLSVVYLDAQGNVVSGSTATSGIYLVKDITPGHVVDVTASAPGFSSFQTRTFDILADTVSEGRISGTSTIPILYGNVSYAGSKTGRIYLSIDTNNGTLGTSIPGPGPFAIRGVPNGTWTLNAYRDAAGIGVQTASAPSGSVSVNMIGTTLSGLNITLTDPVAATPAAPTYVGASPGDSSVIIGWEPPRDANGKDAADSFDVYWDTSALVSTASINKKTIPAGQDSPAIIDGLTNGQSLYFIVVSKRGTSASAATAPFGPVVIGPVTGGHSVSGTVSVTGGTAPAGPLYVAIAPLDSKGAGGIYYARIASPVFPQNYTVTGVPNGYYEVYAIIDANADGTFGVGDISASEDSVPKIAVNDADISGLTSTIVRRNATIDLFTNHGQNQDGTNVWYNTDVMVRSELKRPVQVILTGVPAGINLTLPMDVGLRSESNEFQIWTNSSTRPTTTDYYTFDITYSDGTRETGLKGYITGVNDAFPTSVAVSSSTVPTFSWVAPSPLPASYSIWVGNSTNYNKMWENWQIPSSRTSVVYNSDGSGAALAINTTYNANVSSRDSKGNQASINLQFTPTVAAPADTTPPTISLTTPANGATGVPVNTTLSVRFSEPIDSSTMPNMSTFLQSGATYVQGTGSYDAINDLYIFTPLAPLANNTTYTATFSGIKDLAGNTITTTTRTFTTVTGVDTTAPVTTASPAEGLFNANQTVTLTVNEPATIYYTTNGATPTTSSPVYSTPLSISATTTLRFFAKDSAGNSETVKTQTYTIDKTAPVTSPSPAAGTYGASTTVTLTASETATIYYTTDGTDPTTSSAVYGTPILITATPTTIKFFARDAAGNSEAIQTAVYVIDTSLPVTTVSPAGGLYNAAQSVTLTVNKNATVYYTTNGSVPTTSSPVYSGPITISSTTTLQYFAKDVAGNSEAVKTAVYTIDTVKPTVTSTTPAALATGVAVDSSVTIVFSEDVKESTVNSANIQLSTATTALAGAVVYNPASRTVTFAPSGLLPAGTVIYLSIANVEDMAGNKLTSANRSFTTALPDGDYNGDGAFTIADVNEILKAALLKNTPTAAQLSRADISPLVGGKPAPDGVIDVSDVVVSLRKLVGLVSW